MYEQHKICNTSYNRFKLHVFLQLPDCQFPNKTNVKRNTKTDVNFICMRNIILPLINCLCYVVLKMRCFKNQKIWNFAITLWIIYLLFDKVSFPLVHCNITQKCFAVNTIRCHSIQKGILQSIFHFYFIEREIYLKL